MEQGQETGVTEAPGPGAGAATFDPAVKPDQIHITSAAGAKLAELQRSAEEEGLQGIRLFVTGAGCSGMTYSMTFAERPFAHDCVYQGDGFRLYVDAIALAFLEGVEIDFQELPGGESFVFNNVFAATGGSGTCSACGGAPV